MRNVSVSGCFADKGTLADRIHDGKSAESDIEDELDTWWGGVDHIGTDYYDNSLEVYFEDHMVDLEATPEQQQAIYDMGFSRFWLNFKGGQHKGGTERHYVDPKWVAAVKARLDKLKDKSTGVICEQ